MLAQLARQGAAIDRLTSDSRRASAGAAFFAWPGASGDGRRHIAQAIERGCAAVLWESEGFAWEPAWRTPNAGVKGLREQAGLLAHEFYGRPSEAMWVCGVTGTNGKTSCSQWLTHLFSLKDIKTAVIGTLGSGFPPDLSSLDNTTPGVLELHRLLAEFKTAGAGAVAMEVSSHGLDQGRVNGVAFDCALFTNLTHDHLDYHGTLTAYAEAKARLFDAPGLAAAVLNLDDPFGAQLAKRVAARGVRTIGYSLSGLSSSEFVSASILENQKAKIKSSWGSAEVTIPQLGRFNVANALGVLGCLVAKGIPFGEAAKLLESLPQVAGRMQKIGELPGQPLVVVDYAHTPDALDKVLSALKPVAQARGGRLVAVFGAGGGRDRGKRPVMGSVAAARADRIVLTSDNPRGEDPQAIVDAIRDGVTGDCSVELDRAKAISSAIASAHAADVVLIAGKGHESFQEVNGHRVPFSDAATAGAALSRRGGEMMSLAEAAAAMQGRAIGPDIRFDGVSTDTRSIGRGELFVAIRGEHFDGHDFLAAAAARGAAAALIDERHQGTAPLPAVVADDTRRGLGRLGRHWRLRFAPALIAIAGSNGKTTTKEMLASILRAHAGETGALATRGNLNTDIGVPLTLLGLRAGHRYCAIELGMNHPGEIAMLAEIAQPTIAVVTNAQREHMEFMKSVEATAEENADALRALPSSGIAVVNADDKCHAIFKAAAGNRPRLEFGLERGDVRGRYALRPLESEIVLTTPAGKASATLAIPGLHNVRNALAAAACAHAAGIAPAAIGTGLSAFRPYSGRLQVKKTVAGATLIDDSYNANPDSVRAAIDVLVSCPGPTALVLGDMGEVGAQGAAFHAEVGKYAKDQGVAMLFGLGSATPAAVKAFGQGAEHFDDIEKLLEKKIEAKTILVKGSRFMRMERVVALLAGEKAEVH